MKPEAREFTTNRVAEAMVDVPDHHGWEHAQVVAKINMALAIKKGQDSSRAYIEGLVHDLYHTRQNAQKLLNISTNEAGDLGPKRIKQSLGRVITDELQDQGLVDEDEADKIWSVVEWHSALPGSGPAEVENSRIADRLSRYGVDGVLSIIKANKHYKNGTIPFYRDGEIIVETDDRKYEMNPKTKVLDRPHEGQESCIYDIHLCQSWMNFDSMKQEPAREWAEAWSRVNQKFLEVFERHTTITDHRVWIDWLEQIKESTAEDAHRADVLLMEGKVNEWAEIYTNTVNNPDLISEKGFQEFYRNRPVSRDIREMYGGNVKAIIHETRAAYEEQNARRGKFVWKSENSQK